MSIAMWQEIKALKARVEKLEAREAMRQIVDSNVLASKPPQLIKKMCPHCGEQRAYYFHVKNCQKNKNNGATQATDGT